MGNKDFLKYEFSLCFHNILFSVCERFGLRPSTTRYCILMNPRAVTVLGSNIRLEGRVYGDEIINIVAKKKRFYMTALSGFLLSLTVDKAVSSFEAYGDLDKVRGMNTMSCRLYDELTGNKFLTFSLTICVDALFSLTLSDRNGMPLVRSNFYLKVSNLPKNFLKYSFIASNSQYNPKSEQSFRHCRGIFNGYGCFKSDYVVIKRDERPFSFAFERYNFRDNQLFSRIRNEVFTSSNLMVGKLILTTLSLCFRRLRLPHFVELAVLEYISALYVTDDYLEVALSPLKSRNVLCIRNKDGPIASESVYFSWNGVLSFDGPNKGRIAHNTSFIASGDEVQ